VSIDPNILIGLSTALGAGIGGAISYLATRRQYRFGQLEAELARLKRDYIDACQQIDAFHQIEEAHAKAAAKLSGQDGAASKAGDSPSRGGCERCSS